MGRIEAMGSLDGLFAVPTARRVSRQIHLSTAQASSCWFIMSKLQGICWAGKSQVCWWSLGHGCAVSIQSSLPMALRLLPEDKLVGPAPDTLIDIPPETRLPASAGCNDATRLHTHHQTRLEVKPTSVITVLSHTQGVPVPARRTREEDYSLPTWLPDQS